jgi:hypothetical protein
MKRSTKSKAFLIILNSLLLALFILSTWCFCIVYNGDDPIILAWIPIIADPILLILTIVLLIYGKRFQIPVFNRLIPFLGIVAFLILIGDPFGYFPVITYNYITIGLIGIYTGITLSILTVATTVAIVVSKQNKSQTSRLK